MQSLASLMSMKQADIGNLDDFEEENEEDEENRVNQEEKAAKITGEQLECFTYGSSWQKGRIATSASSPTSAFQKKKKKIFTVYRSVKQNVFTRSIQIHTARTSMLCRNVCLPLLPAQPNPTFLPPPVRLHAFSPRSFVSVVCVRIERLQPRFA